MKKQMMIWMAGLCACAVQADLFSGRKNEGRADLFQEKGVPSARAVMSAASVRPDYFEGAIKPLDSLYFDDVFELHAYDRWGRVDPNSSAKVYISVSADRPLECGMEGTVRVLIQAEGSRLWDANKTLSIGISQIGIQYTDDSVSIPHFPRQQGYTVAPKNQGVHQLYDTSPAWKQAVGLLETGVMALVDSATGGAVGKAKTISEMTEQIEGLKSGAPSERELLRLNDRYDFLTLSGWYVYDATNKLRDTDFTERAFDIPIAIGKQADWEVNFSILSSLTGILAREHPLIRKGNLPVVVKLDAGSRPLLKQTQGDVVFLIDSTGSMAAAMKNFSLTADRLNDAGWRMKVIGFRDLEEDPPSAHFVGKDNPFVKTGEALQRQLNRLDAEGGGKNRESALDALALAMNMSDWRKPAESRRAIVLITDDATKPKTVKGESVQEIMRQITAGSYRVFIYGPACSEFEQIGKLRGCFFREVKTLGDLCDLDGMFDRVFKTAL